MAKIEGAGRGDLFMLPPERLVLITDPNHPLYDPRVHDELDESFIQNIMFHTVIEPVVVRKNGEAIEVVAGRQRVKAAIEANKRLVAQGLAPMRVKVITASGKDKDLMGISVSENEARRGDGVLVKADKAKRLLDSGYTKPEIATIFCVDVKSINTWLSLQNLTASVRKAVENEEISATAAAELAVLSLQDQVGALKKLREEGGGKITGKKARKLAREGKVDEDKLKRIPIKEIQMEIAIQLDRLKVKTIEEVTDLKLKGALSAMKWIIGEQDGY